MSAATRTTRTRHPQRDGFVSVAVLLVMAMLGLMLVGMALRSARHQELPIHRLEGIRSFYASEAALNMAVREIALDTDFDGDGAVGSIAARNDAAFGGASAAVDAVVDGQTFTLTSRGRHTMALRRLQAVVNRAPDGTGQGRPGLIATYFASPTTVHRLSDVNWDATPDGMTIVDNLNWTAVRDSGNPFWFHGPNYNYGAQFAGKVHIDQAGTWTFYTDSDDGTRLWINDTEVVSNDGAHSMRLRSGTIDLEVGWHDFEVRFFERMGVHGLIVSWSGPGVPFRTVIPPSAFAHLPSDLPQPASAFAFHETIRLWGEGTGSAIDAFDSVAGPYSPDSAMDSALVSTNSTVDRAVEMSHSMIQGDLRIGAGGHPDDVVAIYYQAAVTGTIEDQPIPMTVHQINVPGGLPASDGDRAHWWGTHIYDQDFRLNSWTVGNDSVINVTSPIVGRIDGNVSIQGNAELNILDGASLKLYVYGSVNLYNNAQVNTNTGDPDRLHIYMLGNNQQLIQTDRTQLAARVFNPSGTLAIWGEGADPQSRFYGNFCGRAMEMGNMVGVHVDQRTRNVDESGSSSTEIVTWSVIQPTD